MCDSEGSMSSGTQNSIVTGNIDDLLNAIDDEDFDPDERDRIHDLQTFLMKICHMGLDNYGESAILDSLDAKTPDYHAQDAQGRTALMHACIARKSNVVQFVTSRCSDVTQRDNDGNTVLVYAIRSGDSDIIENILDCDLTTYELLNAKNNIGLTAMDVAQKRGDRHIIQLLEHRRPAHPSVRQLRKRTDKRQPRLPPAAVPTASKPLSLKSYNTNGNPRLPFYHSKSLDTSDHVTKRHLPERGFSADRAPFHQAQCTSDTELHRQSDSAADDDVTPRDNDVTPRNDVCSERGQRSGLPQIASRFVEKARHIDRGRSRRDSVSLPDLRDLNGMLVSSGTTTPFSRNGSRLTLTSQESLDEDVFAEDAQKRKDSSVKKLPVLIPQRVLNLEARQRGFARTRKKSNSTEDFLHNSILF
ncbi:ankyrin repeat domain-containing protein 34B-like [Haliotis cracherodii]|uniref:ankyrin repeat domain-containing protein 34B-like n=1 Tax=Haliotis cracherodii TaxID=6455 RepID=UPI0039EC2D1A